LPTLSQRDSKTQLLSAGASSKYLQLVAHSLRVGQILFAVNVAIYAPMIYTASYIMFLMQKDPFRGQVGGGWALEIETFLGPVKWHRAQKSRVSQCVHISFTYFMPWRPLLLMRRCLSSSKKIVGSSTLGCGPNFGIIKAMNALGK
jgi:hypothetical protein